MRDRSLGGMTPEETEAAIKAYERGDIAKGQRIMIDAMERSLGIDYDVNQGCEDLGVPADHRAMLYGIDGRYTLVKCDCISDIIIHGGIKYRYQGVMDGMAQYVDVKVVEAEEARVDIDVPSLMSLSCDKLTQEEETWVKDEWSRVLSSDKEEFLAEFNNGFEQSMIDGIDGSQQQTDKTNVRPSCAHLPDHPGIYWLKVWHSPEDIGWRIGLVSSICYLPSGELSGIEGHFYILGREDAIDWCSDTSVVVEVGSELFETSSLALSLPYLPGG